MVSDHDLDAIAADARFSGVVRLIAQRAVLAKAAGLADPGRDRDGVDAQFATAAG
jgi:hypothetical protein